MPVQQLLHHHEGADACHVLLVQDSHHARLQESVQQAVAAAVSSRDTGLEGLRHQLDLAQQEARQAQSQLDAMSIQHQQVKYHDTPDAVQYNSCRS